MPRFARFTSRVPLARAKRKRLFLFVTGVFFALTAAALASEISEDRPSLLPGEYRHNEPARAKNAAHEKPASQSRPVEQPYLLPSMLVAPSAEVNLLDDLKGREAQPIPRLFTGRAESVRFVADQSPIAPANYAPADYAPVPGQTAFQPNHHLQSNQEPFSTPASDGVSPPSINVFTGLSWNQAAWRNLFRWPGSPFAPWSTHGGSHQGFGEPLVQESWRNRPLAFGWYMGGMLGSPLMTDWTGTGFGYTGGFRLTWDYDHYWGVEFRYGMASLPQWDSQAAIDASHQRDQQYGLTSSDSAWDRYDKTRNASYQFYDLNFVYYPWGDSRWRPYGLLGLGGTRVKFQDRLGEVRVRNVFSMPLGIGLKYRHNDRLAWRLELANQFITGYREMTAGSNLSITFGMELRFGGTRRAYWPYQAGLSAF